MLRGAGIRGEKPREGTERAMIAYFDCSSGISGDMCLGAIVDAGVPLGKLTSLLKKLPVRGYRVKQTRVLRAGVAAMKVDVALTTKGDSARQSARWKDVRDIILSSSLREDIIRQGLDIFRLLFEAEAKVHGKTIGEVHLHELGAVDCIIDVFGTLIGLDLLGVKEVYSSPVNLGGGSVRTRHGILPVPAPATVEILKKVPVYSSGVLHELTTPTGAALIKYLSRGFSGVPAFAPETTGSGAGSRDLDHSPNILRIVAGFAEGDRGTGRTVTVIETNIDDMNPQVYEYLAERLFERGALDVSLTQTIMKKMRPAVLLSVICDRAIRDDLIDLILRETTSIGVRYYEAARVTMERRVQEVETRHGRVRVKFASAGDIRRITPEYEDCRTIARKSGVCLLEVVEEAKKAAAAGAKGKRR
jgi:uncharacterized protein (TIGR00299 family) protein